MWEMGFCDLSLCMGPTPQLVPCSSCMNGTSLTWT